jgi:putative transposase
MDLEIGRRRPAHLPPSESGNRAILIFVTLCTKNRRPVLANDDMQESLVRWWTAADRWRVGRYVVMPDHIHFFCAPGTLPPTPMRAWMAFWKNGVSREAGPETLWQRDFWDRQLRAGESYSAKWQYVLQNPVRHGLAASETDWPYQGEIHRLEWHD